MELDGAFKKRLLKEEMRRRKEKKLCFECGKEGHQAKFHRQGKKPWMKKKQLNATSGRGGYNETRQLAVADKKKPLRVKTQGSAKMERSKGPKAKRGVKETIEEGLSAAKRATDEEDKIH
jgi:hypothetical protein